MPQILYYDRNEIDAKLLCPECKERFDVPLALPCGDVICDRCIKKCDNKVVKCQSCLKSHQIPKNGFAVNKQLSNLLTMRPEKEYRGILLEELENSLKLLEDHFDSLKEIVNDFERQIKDHNNKIREQIKLNSNNLLNKISSFKDNWISKVDLYQDSGIDSIKAIFNGFNNECIEKSNEWNKILNDSSNEDKTIKEATINATLLINTVGKHTQDLNSLADHFQVFYFNNNSKNVDETLIGSLKLNDANEENKSETKIVNEVEKVEINEKSMECKTQ